MTMTASMILKPRPALERGRRFGHHGGAGVRPIPPETRHG
jgi:hypothetical protein